MIFQSAEFHNIVEVIPLPEGDGFQLNRLPENLRVELNPNGKKRTMTPASCEIRFNLHQGEAKIRLRKVGNGEKRIEFPMLAEVFRGDFFERTLIVQEEWTEIRISAIQDHSALAKAAASGRRRFDPALVRVVLPHLLTVQLGGIEGEISPPNPEQVPRRRYLAYGSSITQGILAVHPTEPYPSQVARHLGVDVFNLGLGGGAHLEEGVARHIAGRKDWDFASLELGINLVRRTEPEVFRQLLRNFLSIIQSAHPDKWVFCVDLFPFDYDFTGNPKGEVFRRLVAEAVAEINSPRLIHVPGPSLLTDPTGHSTDLLHPGPEGLAEITRRLVKVFRLHLGDFFES